MDRDLVGSLDRADDLAPHRDRLLIPDARIYLDGNSLGPLPADTEQAVRDVLDTWRRDAVLAWDGWIDVGERLGDELAPLIGAPPGTVAVCDQTSVNLYKLASAALAHTGRGSIVTDAGNFPSDRYVLAGVAEAAGGRLIVMPEDPDVSTIARHVDGDVGLVAMTHVAYRSGHLHDGEAVTAAAHAAGALMLWDLAHSAGAVPVALDRWGADLAIGCTYKYLNGGPGSPGFLFVRGDLHDRLHQPIRGWFGHDDMFGFHDEFHPAPSIRRFLVGTPSVIAAAATEVGIGLTADAGIERIRTKGRALGDLLVTMVEPVLAAHGGHVASPLDPDRRGSHVAVRHPDAHAVSSALRHSGVIVDFRAPDLIRFGLAPLILRHRDVADAVDILNDILERRLHHSFRSNRSGVT